MPPARFLWHLSQSMSRTLWNRLQGKKTRPSWPFSFEVAVIASRQNFFYCDTLPLEEARAFQEKMALPKNPKITRERASIAGSEVEWFRPQTITRPGTLVYLHGGSYLMGSTITHGDLIERIALRLSATVLGVNYRLAPEQTLEEICDEVVALLKAMEGPIALAGDSAGGGLCVLALLKLREIAGPMPTACALIAPWVDMRSDSASHTSNALYDWGTGEILQKQAKLVSRGAPLEGHLYRPIEADLLGLPPILIHVGDAELQHDDSVRFAQKLKEAGVEVTLHIWPDMIHDFHLFASVLPLSNVATHELADFIGEHLGVTSRNGL